MTTTRTPAETVVRYFPGRRLWALFVDGERVGPLRTSARRAYADLTARRERVR